MRTIVYTDGFNLYYGALQGTPWKWVDIPLLFSNLLEPHHEISAVKYFITRIYGDFGDPDKLRRQEIFFRALQAYRPELEIYYGHFHRHDVMMPLAKPTKARRFAKVIKVEEKGSDVNLAVHLLNDAWLDAYDCAVVVTNDSDLAEALNLVKQHPGSKRIGLVPPRKGQASQRLLKYADFTRRIRPHILEASQLPDPIPGTSLHKPDAWK